MLEQALTRYLSRLPRLCTATTTVCTTSFATTATVTTAAITSTTSTTTKYYYLFLTTALNWTISRLQSFLVSGES